MKLDELKDKLPRPGSPGHDDYDMDEMAWAFVAGLDWPLPHYDQDTFDAKRREDAPEARLASSISHAVRWLRENWPDSKVSIRIEGTHVGVSAGLPVMGTVASAEGRFELAAEYAARGVALVAIEADEAAEAFRQEIWRQDLETTEEKLKPWSGWEIEEIDGRFHAVDHENKLLGSGIGYRDKVHENRHRTESLSVLLGMRKRYEAQFPDTDPGARNDDAGPGM
tara:strand:- start:53 stop:724 length:672 start_codon:yes stop_codon:yes gene_type:complete